jgi:hypothetical protein
MKIAMLRQLDDGVAEFEATLIGGNKVRIKTRGGVKRAKVSRRR